MNIAHASTLPPSTPYAREIPPPPRSGTIETPAWLRLQNAESFLAFKLAELEQAHTQLENMKRAIADAQTAERRFCIELCEAEVTACEEEGDASGADGARGCVNALRGR